MNSHNTKTDSVGKPARVVAEKEDVRVIKSSLFEAADLSISKDDDKGSDPYNSTGQHVVIKSKIDPQD